MGRVWSRNLKNEEAMARVGPQHHKKKVIHVNMLNFIANFCDMFVQALVNTVV